MIFFLFLKKDFMYLVFINKVFHKLKLVLPA